MLLVGNKYVTESMKYRTAHQMAIVIDNMTSCLQCLLVVSYWHLIVSNEKLYFSKKYMA